MSENRDKKKISQYPSITEGTWYSLAVSGIIILMCFMIFIGLWVFEEDSTVEIHRRVSIWAPIITFLAGVITFCTIAWRGMIGQRQLDEVISQGKRFAEQMELTKQQMEFTKRQLALTERQMASAEEDNLANLIQKAASLLSETQEARVAAGIGLLTYVAKAEKATFRTEAINLLVDYVDGKQYNIKDKIMRRAILYIEDIGKTWGTKISANITVKSTIYFRYINGVLYDGVRYIGRDIGIDVRSRFNDSYLKRCVIDRSASFRGGNKIENCQVIGIGGFRRLTEDEFIDCDFSGCTLIDDPTNIKLTGCFYIEDSPPSESVLKQIGSNLTVRNRSSIEEISYGSGLHRKQQIPLDF